MQRAGKIRPEDARGGGGGGGEMTTYLLELIVKVMYVRVLHVKYK